MTYSIIPDETHKPTPARIDSQLSHHICSGVIQWRAKRDQLKEAGGKIMLKIENSAQ